MLNEISQSVSDARRDEVGSVSEEDGAVGDWPVPWLHKIGFLLVFLDVLSPSLKLYPEQSQN